MKAKEEELMKIVFLQNEVWLHRMFGQNDLDCLGKLGEVVVRDQRTEADDEEIKRLLVNADVAVTCWGCHRLNNELVQNSPALRLVIHAGGSVKPVFASELFDRGIRIAANADPLGIGVAETALGLTIASVKDLWQVCADVAQGGWDEHYDQIREMYELKIGVIGAGCAGRHYMKLLRNFDVTVMLYDPYVSSEDAGKMGARKMELEELLKQADVVSVHAPSIPETYHMLSASTLGMMKDDAILINTARGSLLDENALYEHMSRGKLKYACLDVTDPEPPAVDHPLRSLPNVIMSPHLAGLTNNGLRRIGKSVVNQILAFAAGQPIDGEIQADMLKRMA